jgi:hypothetical protein
VRSFLLSIFLLASSGCGAHNSWSVRDVTMESAFVGLTAVDYAQTRQIVKACGESNPFIGRCGEKVDVTLYMVTATLAHILVAHVLDDDARTVFQAATIGIEGHVVFRNYRNGYGPW